METQHLSIIDKRRLAKLAEHIAFLHDELMRQGVASPTTVTMLVTSAIPSICRKVL